MRHYFFDIRDGGFAYDRVGAELSSLDDARNHAISLMKDHLAFQADEVWSEGGWQIEVRDGSGLVLFTLAVVATDAPALGRLRR